MLDAILEGAGMSEAMRHLTLQFLAWLAERPRSYAETMEAWRTSCPRLSVWEDATLAGLVRLAPGAGKRAMVEVTEQGHALLTRQAAISG
jgi:hypothetical protein